MMYFHEHLKIAYKLFMIYRQCRDDDHHIELSSRPSYTLHMGLLIQPLVHLLRVLKEYVSPLIGLYENNGSVSCVGINFLLISYRYTQIRVWIRLGHGQLEIERETHSCSYFLVISYYHH